MDAARPLHQPHWVDLSVCRLLRCLQTRRARAVRAALCNVLSRCICLSLLHARRQLSRSRSGSRFSRQRRADSFRAAVFALLCALSVAATALRNAALAYRLVIRAGIVAARVYDRGLPAG